MNITCVQTAQSIWALRVQLQSNILSNLFCKDLNKPLGSDNQNCHIQYIQIILALKINEKHYTYLYPTTKLVPRQLVIPDTTFHLCIYEFFNQSIFIAVKVDCLWQALGKLTKMNFISTVPEEEYRQPYAWQSVYAEWPRPMGLCGSEIRNPSALEQTHGFQVSVSGALISNK